MPLLTISAKNITMSMSYDAVFKFFSLFHSYENKALPLVAISATSLCLCFFLRSLVCLFFFLPFFIAPGPRYCRVCQTGIIRLQSLWEVSIVSNTGKKVNLGDHVRFLANIRFHNRSIVNNLFTCLLLVFIH